MCYARCLMLDAAQESVDVRLLTNCLQGAKWFWWDLTRTSHSDEARFQSNIASQNQLCTFASMSINFCDDGVYNANLEGKRCSSDLYFDHHIILTNVYHISLHKKFSGWGKTGSARTWGQRSSICKEGCPECGCSSFINCRWSLLQLWTGTVYLQISTVWSCISTFQLTCVLVQC